MKDSLRKWVAGVVLALGMASCLQPAQALENIPENVVDYYEDSVWAVSAPTGGGSAFHISPTFLITNAHVAAILPKGRGHIWRNSSLRDYEVEVVAVSQVYDLAVLYCPLCINMTPKLLKVEGHWFQLGEATYGGGYGFGILAIHAGYIQSFNWWMGSNITDTIAQPGDSGSPQIVVDEDGGLRLVGVRTAKMDHTVLIIPAGAVRGFLAGRGFFERQDLM